MHTCIRTATFVALAFLAGAVVIADESPGGVVIEPSWLRLELEPDTTITTTFIVSSAGPFAVLAADGDCRCITPLVQFPAPADGKGTVAVQMRIAGALPGIKHVVFRTTRGIVAAEVQVAGRGLGEGRDILRDELTLAARNRWQVWFLVHDLRGALRNCGCSSGSLGGIDLLAGLPAACTAVDPSVAVRFLLSGDGDGARPGISAALGLRGWRRDDDAIISSPDPESALAQAGPVVIVPTKPTVIANARFVRPALDGGMVAMVLHLDAERRIQRQVALPIDRSLPADPAILAGFTTPVTLSVADHASDPSACAGCHPAALTAWLASAHAYALAGVPTGSRDDECLSCHTSSQAGLVARAPAVTCAACHSGGAAHAAAPKSAHTTAVACRTCHDDRHHPTFQAQVAWPIIAHGSR